MAEELKINFCIPSQLTEAWIESEAIVVLLDGLDEVPARERGACVAAINDFRRSCMVSTIVCSRTKPYLAGRARLALELAVEIQPLTSEDVERCLVAAGGDGTRVRAITAHDDAVRSLARSPLMLSVMLSVADRLVEIPEGPKDVEICRQWIFGLYLDVMLERRNSAAYTPEAVRGWLGYLARGMCRAGLSEYRVERMQPSWLSTRTSRAAFLVLSLSVISVAVFLSSEIVDSIKSMMGVVNLAQSIPDLPDPTYEPQPDATEMSCEPPLDATETASVSPSGPPEKTDIEAPAPWHWWLDLVLTAISIIVTAPIPLAQCLRGRLFRIDICESIAWSWRAWRWYFAKVTVWAAAVATVLIAIVIGLIDEGVCRVDFSVVVLAIGGLALAAAVLLSPIGGIIPATRVGAGGRMAWCARAAIQATIAATVASLPFLTIGFGLNLLSGTNVYASLIKSLIGPLLVFSAAWVAVIAFYLRGGDTMIQHLALRIVVSTRRHLPWRLYSFLDHCVDLGLMRRAGNGYMFIHHSLQESLAVARSPSIDPGSPDTQVPRFAKYREPGPGGGNS
jgi:hypothetical protein